jgi:Zn-dependent peptidase ImmA (M78 family)/transcriptional regulator with XRE-family HTH domain
MPTDATTPDPLAARLRIARVRLGLKQDEVATRTSLGTSSISEFESGKRSPSISQLREFADIYERSVAWFLEDSAPTEDVVLWRERPEPDVAARVEMNFLRLCEQFANLERWVGETPNCELPVPRHADANSFGYPQAEELAHHVRNDLALGERPGTSLLRVLEEVCHVKVFHLDVQPSGTAASSRSELFGAAVLLNSNNVRWRRSFDLAHELFHLLTWQLFSASWEGTPKTASENEEKFATCFARHLLMPIEPFRLAAGHRLKQRDHLLPDDYYALARQFDVSAEAAVRHWGFINRRSDGEISRDVNLCTGMRTLLEDREHDAPEARPQRFSDLATTALRNGSLSIGRFAEYLAISRTQALRIAEQQSENAVQTNPSTSP